jgi:hypothetical protein
MCAEIGHPRPQGIELRLRDITTIHGSELKDAALIVCSPPCQRYSYMAMPWSCAKDQARMIEADATGEELRKLNLLFDTCFRLQREASEAAGHHIPMIVENVRGAQKWVGRAPYHYGSFYLWGDVPALMPIVQSRKMRDSLKNPGGGSWDRSRPSHTDDHTWESGQKVPGFRFDGSGKTFQSASVDHIKTPGRSLSKGSPNKFGTHNMGAGDKMMAELGVKSDGSGWTEKDSLASHNRLVSNQGTKQTGISGPRENGKRDKMLGNKGPAAYGSRSNSRKAASAMIAKIPYPLASWVAKCYYPSHESDTRKSWPEIQPVDGSERTPKAKRSPDDGVHL